MARNLIPRSFAISPIFHSITSRREFLVPCMWPSATYPPKSSSRKPYAIPAEIVSPSPPRCCARTQWVIAPIGRSRRRTGRMPTGRTEETDTIFCSANPAFWSASSKAFRSETFETALPDVTKNFVGIGNMCSANARHCRAGLKGLRESVGPNRGIIYRYYYLSGRMAGGGQRARTFRGGRRENRLVHAIRVLTPGVVSVEHAVRPVPEPTVEFDGHEVLRAHLESDSRQPPLEADGFGGLHHSSPDPVAPGFRGDRHGQDATCVSFEEEHHRRGHLFRAVFHEREGSFVAQDPVDMVSPESVLSEAEDLESIQCVQVDRSGDSQGTAYRTRGYWPFRPGEELTPNRRCLDCSDRT